MPISCDFQSAWTRCRRYFKQGTKNTLANTKISLTSLAFKADGGS